MNNAGQRPSRQDIVHWQHSDAHWAPTRSQPNHPLWAIVFANAGAIFLRAWPLRRGKERVARILGKFCIGIPVDTKLGFVFYTNFPERTNRLTFQRKFGNVARFINEFVEEGSAFLDIGANQGAVSLMACNRVGPSGHVFAFEPSPKIFSVLQNNISVNRKSNLTAYRCAIGSRTELSYMDDKDDSHLGRSHVSDSGTEILVVNGADIAMNPDLEQFDRIFMKIDTEGYELEVLLGMAPLLADKRLKGVCIEIDEKNMNQFGGSAQEIYSIMDANGFYSLIDKVGNHYDQIFVRA